MSITEPGQNETTALAVVNPNKTTGSTIASNIGLKNYVYPLFFPGSVPGQIDYEYLDRKVTLSKGDVHIVPSAIGTKVGVHVYEPSQEAATDVVVVFFHGNIRPTRYNNEIITAFLNCGATVVGRDFPGYDQSSFVSNSPGSLELALIANDEAVMNWVTERYGNSRIVLCGRSIGTFSWTKQLSHPRVIGAIGLVPLLSLTSLVRPALKKGISERMLNAVPILGVPEKFESVTAATFPAGCYLESMEGVKTTGFQITEFDSRVEGKHVTLFPATEDEAVPQSATEEMKQLLEGSNVDVSIHWVEGSHNALPTSGQFQQALGEILR